MRKQKGLGVMHFVLAIIAVAAVSSVAVPKYQDFVVRSKMAEAFSTVADTKNKLTEFYIMKNRFPHSAAELQAMHTEIFSPPEFVAKVDVKGASAEHDVMIQVFFQREVIPGDSFNDQYLYVSAIGGSAGPAVVQWSCGLQGIDEKYMPSRCLD